ncbi:pirin family protein [Pseudomonas segetis]|uniref:Redox-sensitive bicupin YhaK, pirin superfamily n=1 Tax=Pseudomonas segetis TaxID=298908 RepID=A0A239ACH2_9PSED|nr:pirin family protein [Pseudomonas segetis]SNR93290.1 hypothetical protein SAMN05216255_1080 [Pseudomonas segetis]
MSELQVIQPRLEEIEGQPILRPLPSAKCRSVGPFVFFDHMLEHNYPAGSGMNINQHPHIGLSTLTYLFEGQLQHKDSLGSDQLVQPGDVSWMTAGKQIAHVERTPHALLKTGSNLHGLQVWLALPEANQLDEPSYSHHRAETLPRSESMGVEICMIAGHGFCLESPVPVKSATLYAEVKLVVGASLAIPAEHRERAIYLLEGDAQLGCSDLTVRALTILPESEALTLLACSTCHLVIIGGEPLGPRRMNWNFVSSDPQLIEQARQNWAAQQWPSVPGETARIELPGQG